MCYRSRISSKSKLHHLCCRGRKDCISCIGAHRANLVAAPGGGLLTAETQTTNLINYFGPLSSSSYATFDSGYKYTFDRFNNKFVYIPTNADVGGMMARTALLAFPWFSPAGQQRGVLNNAVKLAYNPSKAQRDRLYPKRINSFITSPGAGTFLFGDKTALGYQSALTESMFAACSSPLSNHWKEQHKLNCLN